MSHADDIQTSAPPGSPHPAVAPAARAFDECSSGPGAIRPHWQSLLASLERLGREELISREENSRRILAEHGVTCFVNHHGAGTDEPWQVDLMPLVIERKSMA